MRERDRNKEIKGASHPSHVMVTYMYIIHTKTQRERERERSSEQHVIHM